MTRLHHVLSRTIQAAFLLAALSACQHNRTFDDFNFTGDLPRPDTMYQDEPVKIRQPVLPEMLVNCRGHVIVPALGMRLVTRGKEPPKDGQYLREERLTPPYRIIPYGGRVSMEQSPQRLNVELDRLGRVIGLYCG